MLKLWDRGTQQILPMTHNVSTNSYELFLRDGIFHQQQTTFSIQLQVGFQLLLGQEKAVPTFSMTAPLPRIDINQGFGHRRCLRSTQGGEHSPTSCPWVQVQNIRSILKSICRILASPIFLKFGDLVEPSYKSLNLKSRRWRHYGFIGNLKDVLRLFIFVVWPTRQLQC